MQHFELSEHRPTPYTQAHSKLTRVQRITQLRASWRYSPNHNMSARPRFKCSCGDPTAYPLVTCEGPHKVPRTFHFECQGDGQGDGDNLCEDCELEKELASQRESQGPTGVITNERVDAAALTLEYLVLDGSQEDWRSEQQVSKPMIDAWLAQQYTNKYDDETAEFDALTHSGLATQTLDLNGDEEAKQRVLNHRHGRYLKQGYWNFAAATYEQAKNHRPLSTITEYGWQEMCIEVLAMTPAVIIEALCGPGLRFSRLRDSSLRKLLEDYRQQAVNRPCEYVLELVDKMGASLTCGEMRDLARYVRIYMDYENADDAAIDYAKRVDDWDGRRDTRDEKEAIENGVRRYVSGK